MTMRLTPCVNRVPSTTARPRSSSLLPGLRVAASTAAAAAPVTTVPLHFQRDSEATSGRDRRAGEHTLQRAELPCAHRPGSGRLLGRYPSACILAGGGWGG